jgi:hypothetical protein
MQRLTTEQFIEKAIIIHGDAYDYSDTEYVKTNVKVSIFCKEHNSSFLITPNKHLGGGGCQLCGIERSNAAKRSNTEDFITTATSIHGNKFNYSNVKYVDNRTPVCIVCETHGKFMQIPAAHLSGSGCFECGRLKISNSKRLTTETFIEKAVEVHGDKYDYSESIYTTAKEKLIIICPIHDRFLQDAFSHTKGVGCPSCANKLNGSRSRKDTQHFIDKANKIHNFRYDYSNSDYIDCETKIEIICKEHGSTWLTPNSHYAGCGCKECGDKVRIDASVGFTRGRFVTKYKDQLCFLYTIKLINNDEQFIKVGITGLTPKQRKVSEGKYQIEYIYQIENEAGNVWDLEKYFHKELKDFEYKPLIKFDGDSECFTLEALNYIPELLQNNPIIKINESISN